ncbi:hypothetical protein NJ76_10685 [Rhodococcus sp. IITR03]|nr:hypothetical protein NJ76_10685 [Rhodococcus sp. IITR03]
MYKRENDFATVLDTDSDREAPTTKAGSGPNGARKIGSTIVLPVGSQVASAPPPVRRPRTERRYRAAVIGFDLFALVVAHVVVTVGYHSFDQIDSWRTPVLIGAALTAAIVSLGIQKAWDERILGTGPEEYRRVVRGYVFAVAALAVAGYGWGTSAGQSWTFGSLLIALVLTLLGRTVLRRHLSKARAEGRCLRSVLVAGDVEEVHELVSRADCLRRADGRSTASVSPSTAAPTPYRWPSTTSPCSAPTRPFCPSPSSTTSRPSRSCPPVDGRTHGRANSAGTSRRSVPNSSSPPCSWTSSAHACTSPRSRGYPCCR